MSRTGRANDISAHIDTSKIAVGYLEQTVSDTVSNLVNHWLTQLHAGHMDPDDFDQMRSLDVRFQRDRLSGNGYGLIVTVGEV